MVNMFEHLSNFAALCTPERDGDRWRKVFCLCMALMTHASADYSKKRFAAKIPLYRWLFYKRKEFRMSKVQKGDTVRVHYTGKLDDGTVFDSSEGREPLEFTVGAEQVIPGFEQAVEGMEEGETRSVTIPAGDAYGEHREDLVVVIPRNQLPPDIEPEVGMQLQVREPTGQSFVVTVTAFDDETVTLDANHPLAGKDLTFDIEVVEIIRPS